MSLFAASIRLEACVPFVSCHEVFDNQDSCCGPDKTLTLRAKITCHEDKPFLRTPVIELVNIQPPLTVKANLFADVDIKKDITADAVGALKETAQEFLEGDAMKELSSLLDTLAGGDSVYCKAPPPTEAPTEAPTVAPSAKIGLDDDGINLAGEDSKASSITTVYSAVLVVVLLAVYF